MYANVDVSDFNTMGFQMETFLKVLHPVAVFSDKKSEKIFPMLSLQRNPPWPIKEKYFRWDESKPLCYQFETFCSKKVFFLSNGLFVPVIIIKAGSKYFSSQKRIF